jgi:hypothetical protein
MKRTVLFIVLVTGLIFSVFGQAENISFDGFWELPNGEVIQFVNNVFMLEYADKNFDTGIFTRTDTQFLLNFDRDSYADFDYTVVNSETIMVTSTGNEWMDGNWVKRNDYSWPVNDHPLVGYWRKTEELLTAILFISPFGWGDLFTYVTEDHLIGREDISYDEDNHSEYRLTIRREGLAMTLFYQFVFDGDDLLVGLGGDTSAYQRYIRK